MRCFDRRRAECIVFITCCSVITLQNFEWVEAYHPQQPPDFVTHLQMSHRDGMTLFIKFLFYKASQCIATGIVLCIDASLGACRQRTLKVELAPAFLFCLQAASGSIINSIWLVCSSCDLPLLDIAITKFSADQSKSLRMWLQRFEAVTGVSM